jgi:hypothetical protein
MKTSFKRIVGHALFTGLLVLVTSSISAQTWQYTGSLSSQKRFVILTTLDNGKVLASGGMANDIPHAECELYDPATASWSLTGSLNVARYLHSVVKLLDGRVAVFGGQSGGSLDGYPINTDVVEIYDPTTGIWTVAGHLTEPREHQTASLLLDGRVLIAGGLTGDTPVADAEIFDLSTGLSTAVAPMQQARYEHQATSLLDGRVMVTGGRIGGWDGDFFNECEIYDPAANAWTVVDPMHQPRMRALLVQFSDGSILAAGGRNGPLTAAPGSELYNIAANTWTETDSMKVPVTWMGSALMPDDRFLSTGGFYAFGVLSTVDTCTPTAEWYDKPNARWYFAPTLNLPRGEHGMAYLHQIVNDSLPTDMVIVGGGIIGDNIFTSTCEILDVGTHALATYEAMPANKTDNSAAVISSTSGDRVSVVYDESNSPIIDYAIGSNEDVSVRIISMDGREVRSYDLGTLASGSYQLAISGSQLPCAAYVAIIQTGITRTVEKLIISH